MIVTTKKTPFGESHRCQEGRIPLLPLYYTFITFSKILAILGTKHDKNTQRQKKSTRKPKSTDHLRDLVAECPPLRLGG